MRSGVVTLILTALLSVGVPSHATTRPAPSGDACTVRVAPGDDVVRAAARAAEGATVCFAPGTYRLTRPIEPRAGQTFEGDGARLLGSRPLTGFRRTSEGWVVDGQRQQGERTGTCLVGVACTFPDDVLRDGRPLRRVLRAADVVADSYWFDYRGNRIVLGSDPAGHRIDALVVRRAFESQPGGSDVTVRGFRIEEFASPAQRGAIRTAEPGWRIEDNVVARNHGAGISTQGGAVVVGNRVVGNGQLGIGGNGADTLVADNTIARNGFGGFDPAWEAGGAKWALTDGLVVTGNDVRRNAGPGLWTDIDAHDTTYTGNVVTGNQGPGIFHEISTDAVITDNVVNNNGVGAPWLWGGGILVAGSHHVEVARNQLAGNGAGIALIQQDRGVSEVDGSPRLLHDLSIHDNTVRMSGAPSGGVTDNGYDAMWTDPTITWTGNQWAGSGADSFWWADQELSLAGWRALGHDG